ncbi:MAG: hypothetical protein KC620_23695, partial [Myxococcales bacterium]|nr:hypothetical protein [Myxococcales bacterium]
MLYFTCPKPLRSAVSASVYALADGVYDLASGICGAAVQAGQLDARQGGVVSLKSLGPMVFGFARPEISGWWAQVGGARGLYLPSRSQNGLAKNLV